MMDSIIHKLLYLLVVFFLLVPSHVLAQSRTNHSLNIEYPTLDGRLALTGVRVGNDENIARMVDVNGEASLDLKYIQCADPVHYDRPLLIGKNKTLWQYIYREDMLSVFIHSNGELIKRNIAFSPGSRLAREEIVSDFMRNYLVIFLEKDNRLNSVEFIHVDGTEVKVEEWDDYAKCSLCLNGTWSISNRWISVSSHKTGPVIAWCDFLDPPEFSSLCVKISQICDGTWKKPVILDLDYADRSPQIVAYNDQVLVIWQNSSSNVFLSKISLNTGVSEVSKVCDLQQETGENVYLKSILPVVVDETIHVFFSYYSLSKDVRLLTARKQSKNGWDSMGKIMEAKRIPKHYPVSNSEELLLIFSGDQGVEIKNHIKGKWVDIEYKAENFRYLKTMQKWLEIGDFNFENR